MSGDGYVSAIDALLVINARLRSIRMRDAILAQQTSLTASRTDEQVTARVLSVPFASSEQESPLLVVLDAGRHGVGTLGLRHHLVPEFYG